MLDEDEEEGNKLKLTINEEKTKVMKFGEKLENQQIKICSYAFEEVDKFKSLSVMISSKEKEILKLKNR